MKALPVVPAMGLFAFARRTLRSGRTVAVLALVVPVIIVVVRLYGHMPFVPNLVRGEGELEADTLQATRLTQFLGPPSKFGVHHPGPLLAYLLAIPYALSDLDARSLIATCAVITLASITAMTWCLARWGKSLPALAGFLGLTVLALQRYTGTLTSSWPPFPCLFAFGAYLFFAAGFASGNAAGAVGMVVAGSLVLQTNALFVPPVSLTAFIAVALAYRCCPTLTREGRRSIGVAGLLLAVLWLPSVVGEAIGVGNARRLLVTALGPPAGASPEWAAWETARSATLWMRVFVGRDQALWTHAVALVGVNLLVLWSVARLWRRQRFFASLGMMGAVSVASGFVVLCRVPPAEFETHHGSWLAMGTIAGCTAIAAAAATLRRGRREVAADASTSPWPHPVALGVVLTLHLLSAPLTVRRDVFENPEVGRMAAALLGTLAAGRRPHLEYAPGYFSFAEGVLLQLEKRGVTGAIHPDGWPWTSGRWKASRKEEPAFFLGSRRRSGGRELLCIREGRNRFMPYPVCLSSGR